MFRSGLNKLLLFTASLAFLFSIPANAQFYNGMQMEFGKNRVQYDEFIWSFYRFEKFDVYFYTGGREIAQYTSRHLGAKLKEIEVLLDYQLEERLQVIIYNKYSDFKQSNIGLASSSDYNISGGTRLVGSKLFVYFEGDHAQLERQIKAGIAEVLINEMMYGGNWHEVIRNSALLNLPEWYRKGLISYISQPWKNVEDRVKDGVLNREFSKLNHLTGDDAIHAGHSLWHYVAQTYGPAVISNILYMTRVSRNIESGFLFVLGTSMSNLMDDWISYFVYRFSGMEDRREMPTEQRVPVKTKKDITYTEAKLSPDGTKLIYASNEMGQRKVWLYDLTENKRKRIKKWGHRLDRINDFTHPLLGWHPTGELFAILTEEESEMVLYYYNMENRELERRPIFRIEQVNDFSFSDDGRFMIFSAVINGQSDLFLYNIGSNSQEQLTRDGYDDLNPRFIDGGRRIAFASNRIEDTLRIENRIIEREYSANRDIFIYDLANRSNVLERLTQSPGIDETQPMPYQDGSILFLSDRAGSMERYLAIRDSAIAYIDTATHYRYFSRIARISDYPRSILEHEVNRNNGKYIQTIFFEDRYRFYQGVVDADPRSLSYISDYDKTLLQNTPIIKPEPNLRRDPVPGIERIDVFGAPTQKKEDTTAIDIRNYQFSQFPDTTAPSAAPDSVIATRPPIIKTTPVDSVAPFVFPNQRNYNIIYFADKVTTQLDFGFLNQSYQPFMGGYYNPGVSGLFSLSSSDLFEDHRISGVIHPALNLSNSQYLISYEDRSKRLDKQYVFHRQAVAASSAQFPFRIITNEAKYLMRWPFNEVSSIRGTATARYDKAVALSSGDVALREPNQHDFWAILKAEYVFDNTLPMGLNLMRGTRLKLFAEQYKLLNAREVDMTVLGADVRHYLKIHRTLIWATRFAASTSLGNNKLIYYMGGVDGWIAPRFDYTTNIDFTQNYSHQALATNLRGFQQNARNGKTFALINTEIRWPIFNYLLNRPIRSDFFNNFQVVGFGDIGAAWNGLTPYSDENTFNTNTVTTNNLIIIYNTQQEPLIGGYGFGLRSRIWGYFIRADWAWGVEDYEVRPRIFYLSLSLDF